jgi:hypothetical protein
LILAQSIDLRNSLLGLPFSMCSSSPFLLCVTLARLSPHQQTGLLLELGHLSLEPVAAELGLALAVVALDEEMAEVLLAHRLFVEP